MLIPRGSCTKHQGWLSWRRYPAQTIPKESRGDSNEQFFQWKKPELVDISSNICRVNFFHPWKSALAII